MTRMLLTTGSGPAECRLAAHKFLAWFRAHLTDQGLDLSVEVLREDRHGPFAAILMWDGGEGICAQWAGSLLWRCQSPLRPNHRRQNWFFSLVALDEPERAEPLNLSDVRFETFRAGGAGGQHQNKTNSAVRATYKPTGISVAARTYRCQHRNKKDAIERLKMKLEVRSEAGKATLKALEHQAHQSLQRGQPLHIFKGLKFIET